MLLVKKMLLTLSAQVTVLCECVCVCDESTALEHRFYDKVSIAADFFATFARFPTYKII